MQNDGPKTMGMPQGYTVDDLNNDAAAQVSIQQRPSPLDAINADIARLNSEIANLEAETSAALTQPMLIPVPEDERINPLRAIGAGLRAIGGDASSLDSLLAKKSLVANQQRAVEAQNIAIQNSWNAQRLGDLRGQLESKRNQVERFELEAAKIVDEVAADEEERRFASFETQVRGLQSGVGSAEDIIANFPQEFKKSGYTKDFLKSLERRGGLDYQRAQRLAEQRDPDVQRTPSTPEGAAQDAQEMSLLLSRGYHVVQNPETGDVEKVPFSPSEIQTYMMTLEAAMERMPEKQAEVWRKGLDKFRETYREQLGIPEPPKWGDFGGNPLSMAPSPQFIEAVGALENMLYG